MVKAFPATIGFMQPTFCSQLFIDGAYTQAASGKTFPVLNPANNEVLVEVAAADVDDVDQAVAPLERPLNAIKMSLRRPRSFAVNSPEGFSMTS